MKKKFLTAMVLSMSLCCSITAYAQPKTMPDGTIFDAEYYANTYPDVKNAVGTDETALYNHYVQHGKSEGRLAVAGATVAIASNSYSDDLTSSLPTFTAEVSAKYSKKVPVSIGKNDDKYYYSDSEYYVNRLAVCRADYSNDPIYCATRNYILQELGDGKKNKSIRVPITFVFSSEKNVNDFSDMLLNLSVDLKKANVAGTIYVSYLPADGYLHRGKAWENGVTYMISCSVCEDDNRAIFEKIKQEEANRTPVPQKELTPEQEAFIKSLGFTTF